MKTIFKVVIIAIGLSTASFGAYIMAPDGTYVNGNTYTMTPDGSYVGGKGYQMTPSGKYISK